jgi:dipeptidyl aminopeptidase/acylaminoacyl peptidase
MGACVAGFLLIGLVMMKGVVPLYAQGATRGVAHTDVHSLNVDDVLANADIRDVAISPDGMLAAVAVQRPRSVGVERYGHEYLFGDERSDIWLVKRKGGRATNVTRGITDGTGYWRPVWSPDSRRIAVLSTRGLDNVRLFALDVRTGRLQRLSTRGVQLDAMFGENGPPMAWISSTKVICALLPMGEVPFRLATGSPLRRTRRDRAWLKTERGNDPSVSVLEGGIEITEEARPQGQLVLIDVRSGHTSVLAHANIRSVAIATDRRHAAIIADAGSIVPRPDELQRPPADWASGFHYHLGMHRRIAVVPLHVRGVPTWVTAIVEPRFPVPFQGWAPDGGSFALLGHWRGSQGGALSAILISTEGRVLGPAPDSILGAGPDAIRPPTAPPHLRLRAWSPATGFTVFTSEPADGTLLWTADTMDATPVVRLRLNAHLAEVADDVGRDSLLRYRAADGMIYTGRMLLPSGYQRGKRYPTITLVYPGYVVADSSVEGRSVKPHRSWNAFLEPHLFATRGYVVLQPSIPGSSGEPLAALAGYVLPALDTLAAMAIADSTRLGLLGHSHGVIAVLGLLTVTTRFRAAVVINGPSDILHEYSSFIASNVESTYPGEWATTGALAFESRGPENSLAGLWLGATPWGDPARWLRNNPIYRLDRVQTPIMIVQGDNDIFYMSHGDVAFQSLHRLGKRVRYVRYWGEAHVIQSPANIRDLWGRMYSWFGEMMKVSEHVAPRSSTRARSQLY